MLKILEKAIGGDSVGYRHEFKYLGTDNELKLLKLRLNGIIRPDSHAREDGTYLIRSIYFDDIDDRCLHENEDGVDPRSKYRIRIYNCDNSRISLEEKKKESGKCHKISERLNMDSFRMLVYGEENPGLEAKCGFLVKKLMTLRRTRLMKPKVIVQYVRTPYICPLGNVRITFDREISSSPDIDDFFSPSLRVRPVLPIGQNLLEVKYDEFLPDYIEMALRNRTLRYTTFSKYYMCRCYDL
ncbi:MAG: polyphosphate polymerase domain-containing protein [Lachnospiraceae bacterium]|nr:polyphosphate polymerase domain-containing protein [Lachnospiraceae bacterium]